MTKGGLAKEDAKPTVPSTAKPVEEPDPFGDSGDTKAAAKPEVKPDVAAPAKPDTAAKPDADPFGPAPEVAPVNEKGKTDTKTDAKPEVKPDVAAPAKPDTATKPDADPFGPAPEVAPVNEKGKADAKPEAKPEVKPDVAAPAKPDTAVKPDADPFGPAPEVAPVNEKGKADAKPDVAAPVKPEMPAKPEQPESGTNPSKTPDLKPDTAPVIGPEPKPDVKPEAKPDVKPESSPTAGVGPLQAPSFPAADLDASLKAVSVATTVDANSYANWCKLAEVVTYVKDAADAQRQALRTLTEKVAASPQGASAIAASAKKLFDDKATKGGIVLAGTVTGVGTKNGLSGTAIRMEGMTKPVMVFSAKPLDIKESQKVIVFGALVADPKRTFPAIPENSP